MKHLPAWSDQGNAGLPIDIRVLAPAELHTAGMILATGMRDNPLHVRAFGAGPGRRQHRLQRFLGKLLVHVHTHGTLLGADVRGERVGVLGMLKPGWCRLTPLDTLRLAGVIGTGNPPAVTWRICRWLTAWAHNDPSTPHWRVGPLAVLPAWRRRGVGRSLMQQCCQRVDARAASAWLETDLAVNAIFYATFGFLIPHVTHPRLRGDS
ncbi:MAG: GNAT family N-acetyltransferase [Devosia sp.]